MVPVEVLEAWEDEGGALAGGPQGLSRSRAERLRLEALFKGVNPVEITGIDLGGKTPQQVTGMLPRFTALQQQGVNPAFGILVDPATGRTFALRSGLSPQVEETFNGIRFRSGTMTQQVAEAAEGAWGQPGAPLGAHVEGQAAAFMRAQGITDAVLYINGSTPCRLGGSGCLFRLGELLAEDSTLAVYNKNGRRFLFTGTAD